MRALEFLRSARVPRQFGRATLPMRWEERTAAIETSAGLTSTKRFTNYDAENDGVLRHTNGVMTPANALVAEILAIMHEPRAYCVLRRRCAAQQSRAFHTTRTYRGAGGTMSSSAARLRLEIDESAPLSSIELRDFYFAASKKNHPDVNPTATSADFIAVCGAFELLAAEIDEGGDGASIIRDAAIHMDVDEEVRYREACLDVLGLDAEKVEESKADEHFRLWLAGETYSTAVWNQFLSLNGGLVRRRLRIELGKEAGTDYTPKLKAS